jgi:hypothetical protein
VSRSDGNLKYAGYGIGQCCPQMAQMAADVRDELSCVGNIVHLRTSATSVDNVLSETVGGDWDLRVAFVWPSWINVARRGGTISMSLCAEGESFAWPIVGN